MARKKAEGESAVLDVDAQIIKEHGEVIISAEQFLAHPKKSVSISPSWDWAMGGIPQGSWVVINGPPKTGKAQPLTSIVYTPNGPVPMGEIREGDKVCDPFGNISTVVGIFPQGKKEVYRIKFKNGDFIDCCEDHICEVWAMEGEGKKKNGYRNITLRELREDFEKRDKWRRWSVRLASCYFYPKKVLIDPYMMGLLLGDGSFRNRIGFTTSDSSLVDYIASKLDYGYSIKKSGPNSKYDYRISRDSSGGRENIYAYFIKQYGLWNKKSKEKFIPQDYKYNSEEIRWSIIQGLMDTDGTVCKKKGSCSFSTVSLRLANDVRDIVQSLGGLCSIKVKRGIYNGNIHYSYRCRVSFDDPSQLFRLERKKALLIKRTKGDLKKKIDSIEYIGKLDCQCISVNADHGLYVTDHFTTTHNTTTIFQAMANAQEQLGMKAIFVPVEGRLKERDIKNIKNLDTAPDKFQIIYSTKENILDAEKQLGILNTKMATEENLIIFIDSLSVLMQESRMAEFGKKTRGELGQILYDFCGRNCHTVPLRNHIVIGVTHTVANTGNGMATRSEKMPSAFGYQHDIKATLQFPFKEPWMRGDDQIGIKANWLIETHGANIPINRKFSSRLLFGHGISHEAEVMDFAIDLGIIEKSGSWYKYRGDGEEVIMQAQGWEGFFDDLCKEENKPLYDKIYQSVKEELRMS